MPTYGLDFSGIDNKKGKYGYVDFKFWWIFKFWFGK